MNLKDDVASIAAVFRCPASYLSSSGDSEHFLLLAHEDWLSSLTSVCRLPAQFQAHPALCEAEVAALLADRTEAVPGWRLVRVRSLPRGSAALRYSLPARRSPSRQDCCETLAEALAEICGDRTNSEGENEQTEGSGSWLDCLMEAIARLHGGDTPVIAAGGEDGAEQVDPAWRTQPGISNVVPLLCIVASPHSVLLLSTYQPHSVASLLRFSPAAVDTQTKNLFILFQIISILDSFHRSGLSLGDEINLDQFKIDPTLHLLFDFPVSAPRPIKTAEVKSQFPSKLPLLPSLSIPLSTATLLWTRRELTNLQYLLYINHLAGRRSGQPNNHPVVPWVCDFSSRDGGARDLTRSKFRLTKGDAALALTYSAGRHHVTDVLSEITYYTYRARVTERSVLCRYVRPVWVPGQYPASIARIYHWSPVSQYRLTSLILYN